MNPALRRLRSPVRTRFPAPLYINIRKKYKKIITVEDNIRRADWHAWEGKHWDVQRMLRYLPKDETALYRARQLLMSRSYGVDNAIAKIPAKFKNDIGLKYDRLKWRRRRGRLDHFGLKNCSTYKLKCNL